MDPMGDKFRARRNWVELVQYQVSALTEVCRLAALDSGENPLMQIDANNLGGR